MAPDAAAASDAQAPAAAGPDASGVAVRPLRAADKPRWRELFCAYIEFYKASVPDDVMETTWQRLMAGGEGYHQGLVAVERAGAPPPAAAVGGGAGGGASGGEGRVVGIAHLLLHRSTWSPTHYCYLEDLFVDPQARARGVGAALIEATYAAADAQGATKVYWMTAENNYRARGLYDKIGRKSPFIVYDRPQP